MAGTPVLADAKHATAAAKGNLRPHFLVTLVLMLISCSQAIDPPYGAPARSHRDRRKPGHCTISQIGFVPDWPMQIVGYRSMN